MGKLFVVCPKCNTEFSTGFDILLSALGTGNSSKCSCGNTVILTKENVKEK